MYMPHQVHVYVWETCCTCSVSGCTRVRLCNCGLGTASLCIAVFVRKPLTFVFVIEKNSQKDKLNIVIQGINSIQHKICIHNIILFGKTRFLIITENKPTNCKTEKLAFREHLISLQFFSKRNAFQIGFTPYPTPLFESLVAQCLEMAVHFTQLF